MRIALLAIFNETYKRILIMWDYKFNVLTQLITIGLIFIGATYFIGGGQFNPPAGHLDFPGIYRLVLCPHCDHEHKRGLDR